MVLLEMMYEKASKLLHDRSTLQDHEAEMNCLVKVTSQKGSLKVSTQKPQIVFFSSLGEGE